MIYAEKKLSLLRLNNFPPIKTTKILQNIRHGVAAMDKFKLTWPVCLT